MRPNNPRVGVVIGSGGIKTLASVELFRFLDEQKIPIDLLIGCSGGGIIATLKACGYSPTEIVNYVKHFWNRRLFSRIEFRTFCDILQIPFFRFRKDRALLKPDLIKKTLSDFFGEMKLEDLPIPTILQATDVDSGEGIVLESGRIADLLYVSGAQFPFLPPGKVGERWLADGGFSSSLPLLEAVKRGMDVIIAVSLEGAVPASSGFLDF